MDTASVQVLVRTAIDRAGGNVVAAAKAWGVHRNFLIDLLNGKVPRVRNGHKFAGEDPRYVCVAKGIGMDARAFCELVEREQGCVTRPVGSAFVTVESSAGALVVRLFRGAKMVPTELAFDLGDAEVRISVQRKNRPE